MASIRYSREGALAVFLFAAILIVGYTAYDRYRYDVVLEQEFLASTSIDLPVTHPTLTVQVRCDRVGMTHVLVTSVNGSTVDRQVESLSNSNSVRMRNKATFHTVQATQVNITAIDNVAKEPIDKPCYATLKSP